MRVAVVGAGWAGLSAAIKAVEAGHSVALFEASARAGGRARALDITLPDGRRVAVDNGQHILIGAYRESLALMRQVGVSVDAAFLRLPLTLLFPNGDGLRLPDAPTPIDILWGVARARGWSMADKASLLRAALGWQLRGFRCQADDTVLSLCRNICPAVLRDLIEPLCVSALNTPADQASGAVFLRVLKDSLLGGRGASNLLLPRLDLGQLLAEPALQWLTQHGADIQFSHPVRQLSVDAGGWRLEAQDAIYDRVIWATSASVAARVFAHPQAALQRTTQQAMQRWAACAEALRYEAITTLYVWAPGTRLPQPLLALPSATAASNAQVPVQPAQFVFDRGQLGGPEGLLALVVSASSTERHRLEADVVRQTQQQLAPWLGGAPLTVLQTVVEKRATFACTPGLQRPPAQIAPGLLACGDYIEGPYPATLEGAVRSAIAVLQALD